MGVTPSGILIRTDAETTVDISNKNIFPSTKLLFYPLSCIAILLKLSYDVQNIHEIQ